MRHLLDLLHLFGCLCSSFGCEFHFEVQVTRGTTVTVLVLEILE